MKVPAMIAAELRRLTATKMSVIALIALMLVPVLYGGLYLWANQDPYGRLSEVPVALVVEDAGAQINGAERDLGSEVADELLGSDTFDWHLVSADEASAGLATGVYDFTITIPADFSDAIASISSDAPRQAQIALETNDANNYLATTIGGQAVTRIQNTIAEKVVSEAGLTMLDALSTIRLSLVDAADGAGRLVDGLGTAASGTAQLQSGSAALADGTAQVSAGAASLSTGVTEISTNLDRLSAGAAQVAGGTAQFAGIADRVGAASSDVVALVPQARADIAAALRNQGLTEAQIADVLALLDPLAADANRLDGRVQSAVSQIDTLNAGAGQVASGSAQLASGARTAAAGAGNLAAGAASAAGGAAQVRDGVTSLAGGLDELQAGATQLRAGLAEGVGHVVGEDLERPFDAGAGRDGRLCGAAEVGVVEVHETVDAGTHLATLAELLPRARGARGAHLGEGHADRLAVAHDHAGHAAHFASFRGDADAVCGADERHGRLSRRAADLERRGASGVGQRPGREECAAPDGGEVGPCAGRELVGEPADGPAPGIEQAGLAGERLAAVDDADGEVTAGASARCLHPVQFGAHAVDLHEVAGDTAGQRFRLDFGLDGDAPGDGVESAGESQQRRQFGDPGSGTRVADRGQLGLHVSGQRHSDPSGWGGGGK